ncbi:hypothetical protein V6N13_036401 [Hibiscus sabdariffa]
MTFLCVFACSRPGELVVVRCSVEEKSVQTHGMWKRNGLGREMHGCEEDNLLGRSLHTIIRMDDWLHLGSLGQSWSNGWESATQQDNRD